MKIFTVYVQFRSKSKNTFYYFFTLSAQSYLTLPFCSFHLPSSVMQTMQSCGNRVIAVVC